MTTRKALPCSLWVSTKMTVSNIVRGYLYKNNTYIKLTCSYEQEWFLCVNDCSKWSNNMITCPVKSLAVHCVQIIYNWCFSFNFDDIVRVFRRSVHSHSDWTGAGPHSAGRRSALLQEGIQSARFQSGAGYHAQQASENEGRGKDGHGPRQRTNFSNQCHTCLLSNLKNIIIL